MELFITILQLICGLIVIGIVLFQSGKSAGLSGAIGGGGLGKIAIDYGYYRFKYLVMLIAVVLLVVLVQIFQTVGTKLASKCDKRLIK